MDVSTSSLIVVVGMYAAFLVVGWLASRKTRNHGLTESMLAGRAMPLWIATMTMTATWVDGGYLLGNAESTLTSLPTAWQGGVCFGLSLVLGGIFFAGRMRRLEFATMVDPFQARFGRPWAAVLMLPALLGETFWSAALLVAIGATLQAATGISLVTAILLSAGVVTLYTMLGGMWSVAYTDAFQLSLIPLGMLAALPYALQQVGGLEACWDAYRQQKGTAALWLPSFQPGDPNWSIPTAVNWWDTSLMLVFGGIPWNCYFQRVLSCRSPRAAVWHSILAGLLTMALTIPPVLLGMAAATYSWQPADAAQLAEHPSQALPLVIARTAPLLVGMLGMAAIVGAVTSSYSSSVLSAGSMFSWNLYHRLLFPKSSVDSVRRILRLAIFGVSIAAILMAMKVESVKELWFFTSDLVYVLLFPQLLWALFDVRANRIGSITAFCVALVLRLGGGEPIFHLPAFLPYPEWFAPLLPGRAADWYTTEGTLLFPFKSLAALSGLILLPIVSRLTAGWDPPRALDRLKMGEES